MGKFLWEGRENAKKIWYYEKLVGHHASFPPRQSVKKNAYWIQSFMFGETKLAIFSLNGMLKSFKKKIAIPFLSY